MTYTVSGGALNSTQTKSYRTEQISLTHRVLYIRQHYYWLQILKCQKPSYLVEIGDKYLYIYAKYQNKFSTKL